MLRKLGILISVLAFGMSAQPVVSPQSFIRGTRTYTGGHVEFWRAQSVNTWEVVLPLYASMALDPLADGLAIDVVTSPTLAVGASRGVSPDPLFALTGSKFRLSYRAFDKILATWGMQLPSTSNRLSSSDLNTAGRLSTTPLEFKVSRVQAGLDMSATLSTGVEMSDRVSLGMAIGFLLHGSYRPYLEQDVRYNPGDEFSLTIGGSFAGVVLDMALSIVGDIGWTHFWPDQSEKTEVFKAGDQFLLSAQSSLEATSGMVNRTAFSVVVRAKDRRPSDIKIAQSSGIVVKHYLFFPSASSVRMYPIGKIALYSANGNGVGRTFIGGFGGGVRTVLKKSITARTEVLVQPGAMDGAGVFGAELSGGLHYVF